MDSKVTLYFDTETCLLYKTKSMILKQMQGEAEAETVMDDYKKIEGMMTLHSKTIFQ